MTAFEIYINRWALTILLVIGVFLAAGTKAVAATNSTTSVSAQIISPTEVSIVTAAELLQSASTGVLTLSIPGGGATGTGDGTTGEMTLTSTGVRGNTIIFSTTDSAHLASLVQQALAASGGSFGMNGILSNGLGVNLLITQVEQNDNGTGRVYAILVYN